MQLNEPIFIKYNDHRNGLTYKLLPMFVPLPELREMIVKI